MAEPSSGAAAGVAAVSTFLMALLGVDYYSLLWAAVSAFFMALYSVRPTDVTIVSWKKRSFFVFAISTLLGAAGGTFTAELLGTFVSKHFSESRATLMICSVIVASAPQRFIQSGVNAFLRRIEQAAGSPPNGSPPPTN